MSSRIENLIGQKFGRLTVVESAGRNQKGKIIWKCKCDCGNFIENIPSVLKNGGSKSCGCYNRELILARHEEHRANMVGMIFGKLKVLRFNRLEDKKAYYDCKCTCGTYTTVQGNNLSNGHTKSCGCLVSSTSLSRSENFRKEMIGKVFGRLTVKAVDRVTDGGTYYSCICSCGTNTCVLGTDLTKGNTSSCGCYRAEKHIERVTTHGLSGHRLYGIWNGMIQRCSNTNVSSHPYYGGKGIVVCPQWKSDFKAFYDWAMANGYQDGLSIDRYPDVNGNYEPGNCRWATTMEQVRNRSYTKLDKETAELIRSDPRTQVIIAEQYGVSQATVSSIKRNKIWKD